MAVKGYYYPMYVAFAACFHQQAVSYVRYIVSENTNNGYFSLYKL